MPQKPDRAGWTDCEWNAQETVYGHETGLVLFAAGLILSVHHGHALVHLHPAQYWRRHFRYLFAGEVP